ncbi:Hypothetical predicted protein, partial [Pelobates cultripes]
ILLQELQLPPGECNMAESVSLLFWSTQCARDNSATPLTMPGSSAGRQDLWCFQVGSCRL